jgi:hypothetical protein
MLGEESQVIWRRGSLLLCKSFNTLCLSPGMEYFWMELAMFRILEQYLVWLRMRANKEQGCSPTLAYFKLFTQCLDWLSTGPMFFVFCRLYPFSPSHHSRVWVLPVISLLSTYTVSPVRACLIIWLERFRGTNVKTIVCLLVFNPLWWLCTVGTFFEKFRNLIYFFLFLVFFGPVCFVPRTLTLHQIDRHPFMAKTDFVHCTAIAKQLFYIVSVRNIFSYDIPIKTVNF